MHRYPTGILCGLIALPLLAGSAWAETGAREIDPICAVQTGCFPGDAAGYPVTIGASGSYLLTDDLTVANENTTAIEITAPGVTLDLNGFGVYGPVYCAGLPPGCTATGTGIGISIQEARATIRNGSVQGMGAHGIAGSGVNDTLTRIENVAVGSNAGDCIVLGTIARIHDSRAIRCAGNGFAVLNSALITDSQALFNGGAGLTTSSGPGLNSAYRSSVFEVNGGGTVTGNAIQIGTNVCDGNTTCP